MDTRLPVYRVVTTGIPESQAHQLAEALRIPAKGLRWLDGEASFVDRHKYLAVKRPNRRPPHRRDRKSVV